MRENIVSAAAIILCFLFRAPLCTAAEPPIKIGVIQSLTGVAREDGQTVVRALALAKDRIDKEGGITLELLLEDDGSQARNTVAAFHKLSGQGVAAIVGPTWLHTLASIVPLAGANKVVLLNTSNFPEAIDLSQGRGYVFTNAYSLTDDLETFRRYLAGRPAAKVAFINNQTNWALLQVNRYRALVEALSIHTAGVFETPDLDNNDWRPIVPALKASGADTVVFFLGKDDAEVFLRRARDISLAPQMFGGSHTYDAFKRTADTKLYENVCITYPLARLQSRPEFVDLFTSTYHEPPQLYADSSYDALLILAQALISSARTKKALHEVLKEEELRGLFGHYRWDRQKSLAAGRTSLNCVRSGALRIEEW